MRGVPIFLRTIVHFVSSFSSDVSFGFYCVFSEVVPFSVSEVGMEEGEGVEKGERRGQEEVDGGLHQCENVSGRIERPKGILASLELPLHDPFLSRPWCCWCLALFDVSYVVAM